MIRNTRIRARIRTRRIHICAINNIGIAYAHITTRGKGNISNMQFEAAIFLYQFPSTPYIGRDSMWEETKWPPAGPDSVLKSFEISLEALEEISSLLRKDFDKGLESEGDDVVVKMLNTYVHSLPDGTEKGSSWHSTWEEATSECC
eukprot:Em0475g3a